MQNSFAMYIQLQAKNLKKKNNKKKNSLQNVLLILVTNGVKQNLGFRVC